MTLLRITYPVLLGGMAGWVPVLVAGPLPPTASWTLPDWYSTPPPWAPEPPAAPQPPAMAGAGTGGPAAVLEPAAEPEGGTPGAETAGGTAGAEPAGGTAAAETEMGRGPDQGAGAPRPVPRAPNCLLVRISSTVPPRSSRRSAGKMGTHLHQS